MKGLHLKASHTFHCMKFLNTMLLLKHGMTWVAWQSRRQDHRCSALCSLRSRCIWHCSLLTLPPFFSRSYYPEPRTSVYSPLKPMKLIWVASAPKLSGKCRSRLCTPLNLATLPRAGSHDTIRSYQHLKCFALDTKYSQGFRHIWTNAMGYAGQETAVIVLFC